MSTIDTNNSDDNFDTSGAHPITASTLVCDEDAPKTLHDILHLMEKLVASDVIVSAGAAIKFKIDGVLIPLANKIYASEDIDRLLAEELSPAQLAKLEAERELNCTLSKKFFGHYRISAFMQRGTKAFVIRFIPFEVPSFESLSLPTVLADFIMEKRGLILITGPTGSGKSTTMASMVDFRNRMCSDHIMTIEDPIEFHFSNKNSVINQRELGTDFISYRESMQNILRQAPNVIMIGEIRDRETVEMVMQYAASGHLCIASMHANNSYNAIDRIVSFYPPEHRHTIYKNLSTTLRVLVSQRLIPTSGEKKLAPAVEILVNTESISQLIGEGSISKIPEMMDKSMAEGMQTFEKVLLDMVVDKKITPDVAILYADSSNNMFGKLTEKGISVGGEAILTAGVDREKLEAVGYRGRNKKSGTSNNIFKNVTLDTSAL